MSLGPAACAVTIYALGVLVVINLAGARQAPWDRVLRRLGVAARASLAYPATCLVVGLTLSGRPGVLPRLVVALTGATGTLLTAVGAAALLTVLGVMFCVPPRRDEPVQDMA